MDVMLAIDLGGTSLRAGLVSPRGQVLALAARPHRIREEADARDWWAALGDVLAELPLAALRPAGIGLSGFTRSQVLADAQGVPVRPAQCFPDGRATAEAEALAGAADGTWTAMTAWHPLARLDWARRHDAPALARARHLLQPKDFLALCLTGRAATDRIANAWAFERATGALAKRDGGLLPDMLEPWDVVGPVSPGLPTPFDALAGLPVACGSMDAWCAVLGAGAARAGGAYIISGTTDVAGAFTAAPADAPGLVTLPWGEGLFHVGGPSQSGADCAAWAAGLLGVADAGAVADLASQADGRGGPLLFLPYLTGERAPLWQPGARGCFLGLHRDHGPPALARAVLEGVALANRDLLGRVPHAGEAPVVLTGGGARSELWCQIRADALRRPLLRADVEEPGLVGAAACAFIAAGHFPGMAAAQAAMAPAGTLFTPDAAQADRFDALFPHFRALQEVAVPLATTLSNLPA